MMTPAVTTAAEGLRGIHWNILGQVYTPMQMSAESFAWHALLPPETFVPPHIHPTQDEFVLVLDGQLDAVLDGEARQAGKGDLLTMPRGIPHGLFNNSGKALKLFFWVTPTGRLFDLFTAIHNLPDAREVVRRSALHEVEFLPPGETRR